MCKTRCVCPSVLNHLFKTFVTPWKFLTSYPYQFSYGMNQERHVTEISKITGCWHSHCFFSGRAHSERDGTRAETRFGLSAKRTSPFKLAGGGRHFSRLLAAEVCASAAVMVVMLDTPCSEVACNTTGYPLHSHVSPWLPLPCVTVCHQVSTELYYISKVSCVCYKMI